jgi:hypothetical protein
MKGFHGNDMAWNSTDDPELWNPNNGYAPLQAQQNDVVHCHRASLASRSTKIACPEGVAGARLTSPTLDKIIQ